MAFKQFELPEIGSLKIYKRRGSRSFRLSVSADGQARVTIPYYVPYNAGVAFAKSRAAWVLRQKHTQSPGHLQNGQLIGKAHRLQFMPVRTAQTVSTRVGQTEIIITHPFAMDFTHQELQLAASKASIRALKRQAEKLLPIRLKELADLHGLEYRSVKIKQLKSRWGSCDQHKNIVLNLFLMQLPWQCIDYVLIHELTHTKVLQHGPKFWTEMERYEPRAKQLRKIIRDYRPVLSISA